MRTYAKRIVVLVLALLLVSSALTVVSALGDFRVQCESVSEKVLRLHVLANSDSEEDQQLKLKVRDAILAESDELFFTSQNKAEAMENILKNREQIETLAEDTLRQNGCTHPVEIQLAEVYFNTRTYGDVTMPAGYYDALQVKIGVGAGKNWWCVLFPALCVPSAASVQMEDVLTEEEMRVLGQSGYDVRFKIVELYENFMGLFR